MTTVGAEGLAPASRLTRHLGRWASVAPVHILVSPVEGRLLGPGDVPQPDIRVRRSWSWVMAGRHGHDSTVTDAEGHFAFGAVRARGWGAAALPHAPEIRQEIFAYLPVGEVLLMRLKKPNYALHGERDGRPLRLICRPHRAPEAEGGIWGTCHCVD